MYTYKLFCLKTFCHRAAVLEFTYLLALKVPLKYTILEKVTRFTGFAGGKVIKVILLTFRLQSSFLFADSTWPF